MAIQRDQPYEGSSFTVDLGTGDDTSFVRVALPAASVAELTYRSGSDPSLEARREPGLVTYGHLVLSRGLDGRLDLWQWWLQARAGDRGVDRNVRVVLLDEQRTAVWVWKFRNAFPVTYRVTTLDSTTSDVVVEEIELAFDSMDVE